MWIWRADLREISSWDLSMRMVNSWWMVLPKRAQVSLQKKSWDECAGTCNIPALSSQWFSQWLLLKTLWWQRIWSVLSLLVGLSFCLVTCVVLAGAHTLAEPSGSDNRDFPHPSPAFITCCFSNDNRERALPPRLLQPWHPEPFLSSCCPCLSLGTDLPLSVPLPTRTGASFICTVPLNAKNPVPLTP